MTSSGYQILPSAQSSCHLSDVCKINFGFAHCTLASLLSRCLCVTLFVCTGVLAVVSMTACMSTTCPSLKLCLTFTILQKTQSHFANGCVAFVADNTNQILHTTSFACFKTKVCYSAATPRTLTAWREVRVCVCVHRCD